MLGFLKPKDQGGGAISYFKLSDWWNTEFTSDERRYINSKYQPMGGETNGLTQGKIDFHSGTSAGLLSGLSSWFTGPEDRDLCRRILKKAESEALLSPDILDLHFVYSASITAYYRDRDKVPEFYERAKDYCRKQIEIAPKAATAFKKEYPWQALPAHVGYEQLVIILDKEGKQQEAIDLSADAKIAGWAGDWDDRIERYKKKLKKSNS